MEDEPGSAPSLRASNRLRVVKALQLLGVTSRADLARHTGLSRSTVSTIVAGLQAEGMVVDRDTDGPAATGAGGRPPLVAVVPSASRSTTMPSAWRPAMIVETVDLDKPVWRARCARLVTPSSCSARMTRSLLDARRDGAEPGSSSIRATLPNPNRVCQGSGRSSDEFGVN